MHQEKRRLKTTKGERKRRKGFGLELRQERGDGGVLEILAGGEHDTGVDRRRSFFPLQRFDDRFYAEVTHFNRIL